MIYRKKGEEESICCARSPSRLQHLRGSHRSVDRASACSHPERIQCSCPWYAFPTGCRRQPRKLDLRVERGIPGSNLYRVPGNWRGAALVRVPRGSIRTVTFPFFFCSAQCCSISVDTLPPFKKACWYYRSPSGRFHKKADPTRYTRLYIDLLLPYWLLQQSLLPMCL